VPPEAIDESARFGETLQYSDGLSISISKPRKFVPHDYAAFDDSDHDGQSAVKVTVTIKNGTAEAWKPTFDEYVASSSGKQAGTIMDDGLSNGQDAASIRPGKSGSFDLGFQVSDAADLQVDAHLYSGGMDDATEREVKTFVTR